MITDIQRQFFISDIVDRNDPPFTLAAQVIINCHIARQHNKFIKMISVYLIGSLSINNIKYVRLIWLDFTFSDRLPFIGQKGICHRTAYQDPISNSNKSLNDRYFITYFSTAHHGHKWTLRLIHSVRNRFVFTLK
ncbi:hypothetical protein D9M69_638510 [compost metagenome]